MQLVPRASECEMRQPVQDAFDVGLADGAGQIGSGAAVDDGGGEEHCQIGWLEG